MNQPYGKLNGAAVDYITFTTTPKNGANQDLIDRWMQLQTEAEMTGHPIKPMSPQGYHGFQTPHLFWGIKPAGCWFRASSDIADQVVRELIHQNVTISATRLDLQVTILTPEPWPDFASFIRDLIRLNEEQEAAGKRMTINLIESDGKGDTVYVGSKDSTRRLTIYDKTAEQKRRIRGNQYRFELCVRHQQAKEVWGMLQQAADVRWLCMSLVAGILLANGLPIPWGDETEPVGLPSTYHRTNQERITEWIISQVAPAFKRVVDDDYRERVRVALNL